MGIVSIKDVTFSYNEDVSVLNQVSLEIEKGEFVCILGGNGSGKSTLAKHINALLLPDAGSVCTCDMDTSNEKMVFKIRSQAGMVFQNPDDQIVASIVENDVAFGPENLGIASEEIRNRVTTSLEKVGMSGSELLETHSLSGGQKQCVALAGVLAMNVDILILDEATAMLDPQARRRVMDIVKQLHATGMTIIMITHFMEEAAQSDRIVIMENSRIALDGPPSEILVNKEALSKLNLDVPPACAISMRLQDLGLPINIHTTNKGLEEELCQLLLNK